MTFELGDHLPLAVMDISYICICKNMVHRKFSYEDCWLVGITAFNDMSSPLVSANEHWTSKWTGKLFSIVTGWHSKTMTK